MYVPLPHSMSSSNSGYSYRRTDDLVDRHRPRLQLHFHAPPGQLVRPPPGELYRRMVGRPLFDFANELREFALDCLAPWVRCSFSGHNLSFDVIRLAPSPSKNVAR